MITRQEIESFIPGQWTLSDEKMGEIKDRALLSFDLNDIAEAAADLLLYSREGGPHFCDWDKKFDALKSAVDSANLGGAR